MTAKLGRVPPLENLGANLLGDEQAIMRAGARIRMRVLGPLNHGLDLPGVGSCEPGERHDGFGVERGCVAGEEVR